MTYFRFASRVVLVLALFGVAAAGDSGPVARPHNWTFFGPAPIFDGVTRFSGRIDVAVRDPLDPNVMYVGGSGGGGTQGSGLWKTSNWLDTNPTWQPLIDDLPSLSIFGKSLALFPGPHGGILYAAAQGPNGGILRSVDGGAHWKYLAENLFGNALFGAIAISPVNSKTVYAAVGGNTVHGLYRSSDGGKSWANITDPSIGLGAASDVAIDPNDASTIYTGILNGMAPGANHGGVYKSTDGGDSWTPMALPLPTNFKIGSFIALRIAPSNPDYVYATVFGANNGSKNPELQRFGTTDGGASWNLLTLPNAHVPSLCSDTGPNTLQDFRFWHVVLGVDPGNPQVVYANACEPTFVVSRDAGKSWKEISNANDDVVNAFFDDSGDLALVGDRGIHLSTDTASMSPTFSSKQGNLGNFLIHTLELDPLNSSIIDAVSQDQLSGIQFTGSTTWNYLPAGSEVGRFLINPNDDALMYTWGFKESGVFLQRSEDGGQDWASEMNGLVLTDFQAEDEQFPYNAFALDPDDPAHLVLGGQHVWQAIDEGPAQPLTWSMISTPPSAGNQITAIAVAPNSSGQTIYAATLGNRFFITTNGGGSWNNISPQPPNTGDSTTSIVIDPGNPARLFVNIVGSTSTDWNLSSIDPSTGGRIWMTTTGGASWNSIDGDLPANVGVHTLAADFAFHKPALFAGTDRGVFWSRNLGKHWTILKRGLPNVTIDDMEFLPQTGVLAVGTFGRGVWETVIPGGH